MIAVYVGVAFAAGLAAGGLVGFRAADRLRQVRREVIDWQGEEIATRNQADLANDRNVLRINGRTRRYIRGEAAPDELESS